MEVIILLGHCALSDDEGTGGHCALSDDEGTGGHCALSDDEGTGGHCALSDDEGTGGHCALSDDEGTGQKTSLFFFFKALTQLLLVEVCVELEDLIYVSFGSLFG